MELELRNRVAVVTGGASGIGAACARALAGEGARVAVLDRDGAKGRELVSALISQGNVACFVEADVTDEGSVAAAVEETVVTLGPLDLLVSCAGVSGPVGVPVGEVSRTAWEQVMAVNATGTFLVTRKCLPFLERSPVGTAVLLGSDASFVAFAGMTPYCASKGAVLMFARGVSVDHPSVRINCLCPSVVDTPMSRRDLGREAGGFDDPAFPVMSAEQLAGHALFLASPVSAPINGTALVVDFGYMARSAFPEYVFAPSGSM